MKQDNSQNTASAEIHIPTVVSQILKKLWVDETALESEASKVSSGIDGVLKIYENAQDKAISNLRSGKKQDVKKAMDIIALDSSAFDKLEIGFKDNLDIWKQTLKAYIDEWKSFLEVQSFIQDSFAKKKQPALSEFYRNHLKMSSEVFLTNIEKQLMVIDERSPKIYKTISHKILKQNKKRLALQDGFLDHFQKTILENDTYHQLDQEKKDAFDISTFQKFLWLKSGEMTPDILTLILSLRELIQIKDNIKKTGEDSEDLSWEDDTESVSQDDEAEVYSWTDYSITFLSESTIDIWAWQSLQLTPEEIEMNDLALENYVQAVKVCRELGLWFIFKHKRQFLSSICGIDYLSGEWLSESKILKILNKLGKKIWIPEKSFVDETSKDKTPKIWCFQTLWEAKYQFGDIQSTGIVGGLSYDPMKSDRSVTERALIQKWFFDLEWKWFLNIKDW